MVQIWRWRRIQMVRARPVDWTARRTAKGVSVSVGSQDATFHEDQDRRAHANARRRWENASRSHV